MRVPSSSYFSFGGMAGADWFWFSESLTAAGKVSNYTRRGMV